MRLPIALASCVTFFASGVIRAAPDDGTTPITRAGNAPAAGSFDALLAEGTRLADVGDHAGALALFDRAYSIEPSARVVLKRAVVLVRLGRDLDAAVAFQDYLDDDNADPAITPKVRVELAKLDARLGHLSVAIVGAEKAEIRLDAGPWIRQPSRAVRVVPGAHTVEARHAGAPSEVVTRTGEVRGGETIVVAMDLTKRLAPLVEPGPADARRRARRWRGPATVALGVVGMVAGGVLLWVVDEEPVVTPTRDPTYTEATLPGALSLVAGGALAGVGVYFTLHDRAPAAAGSRPTATSTDSTSLGLVVRF